MGARQQLADALTAKLPKTYQIIPVPRELDELSAKRPVVQVIRLEVEHAPNQGSLKETFQLWALTPKKDQPAAEDDLERVLFNVIKFLDTSPLVTAWTKATRATHVSGAQAYRIDLTVYTEKEY